MCFYDGVVGLKYHGNLSSFYVMQGRFHNIQILVNTTRSFLWYWSAKTPLFFVRFAIWKEKYIIVH